MTNLALGKFLCPLPTTNRSHSQATTMRDFALRQTLAQQFHDRLIAGNAPLPIILLTLLLTTRTSWYRRCSLCCSGYVLHFRSSCRGFGNRCQ